MGRKEGKGNRMKTEKMEIEDLQMGRRRVEENRKRREKKRIK